MDPDFEFDLDIFRVSNLALWVATGGYTYDEALPRISGPVHKGFRYTPDFSWLEVGVGRPLTSSDLQLVAIAREIAHERGMNTENLDTPRSAVLDRLNDLSS